jgi:hypothetical protein
MLLRLGWYEEGDTPESPTIIREFAILDWCRN